MAMERTRIAKVENVALSRRGEQIKGTLHLTPHHIIFVHSPPTSSTAEAKATRPRELWITYPIIAFCTLRPTPAASRQPSSIRLRCRDFTFVCFYFQDERNAKDAYESIKAWTCKLGKMEKLYAFSYQPQGPEKDLTQTGWTIYDPMREWRRMGVGDDSKKVNWRISNINLNYAFSPTYPALLPVPSSITDNHLNYAGRYRSRVRIPVLTYLHPVNNCSITRCAQPLVGIRQNRSVQDEALLAAIFSTTRSERPLSHISAGDREESGSSKETNGSGIDGDLQRTASESMEDAVIAKLRGDDEADVVEGDEKKPIVYGAQQRNMIVDARPTVNAYAMQAVGAGSENMDNYKFATKVYLGIDNIHVMRDSLQKVIDTLKDSDLTPLGPNRDQLHKSNWLKHIANMMDGVSLIARQVGLQHSHVLIHCSDGWDRTSQLSALAQICLDPYYRTLEGFIVLVEKDWVSFGHMFKHRSGFLNSEKWFQIENERISGRANDDADSSGRKDGNDAVTGAQKRFENAFLSAKGFFTKQNNDSRESINVDSDADPQAESDTTGPRRAVSGKGEAEKPVTKVKETAPIFHQFLDATFQLMYQHPTRFEFNERFLRRLLYHLYSCQYGTFLFDSEKERKDVKLEENTRSVWDYFLARRKEFMNPLYNPTTNDNVRGQERLIFPRTQEVRWWASVFGRTDEEMNGAIKSLQSYGSTSADGEADLSGSSFGVQSQTSSMPVSRSRTPVLIGVETSEGSVGVAASRSSDPLPVESIPQQKTTGSNPDTEPNNNLLSHTPPQTTTTARSQSITILPQGSEMHYQIPDSAPEQEAILSSLPVHTPGAVDNLSSPASISTPQPDPDLNLDPLGIGDVTDHVPNNSNTALARRKEKERATTLDRERRREKLQVLMQ